MAAKPKTPEPEHDLGEFDGMPVKGMKLSIKNTGDGLSAAVKIEPVDIAIGDTVTLLVEATCTGIAHKRIAKDIDVLVRIPDLRAGLVTFVDPDAVEIATAVDAMRVKLEEAEGVHRLPLSAAAPADDLEDEWPEEDTAAGAAVADGPVIVDEAAGINADE